ncbi:MAG: FAD-dependent oxidoreductase [Candidatus Helarchaeota archaeon]|nr:FAD-dependent oxidoreductase [Candidatus Helarchaeota archaeon]
MSKKPEVSIVGGGVGGCAIGALLAHKGFQVRLFDKNKNIGGRCTTQDYKGFKIDLGVHLFGVGPNGSLGEVCREIERPDAIKWILARDPRPILNYCGDRKVYSIKTMSEMLKDEKEMEVGNKFWYDCTLISKNQIKDLYYVKLTDFLFKYSKNPILLMLVTQICLQYFCVSPYEASAGEFVRCFQEVTRAKSSAYPLGGCISIPDAYAKAIVDYRGNVQLNTQVSKIITEDGSVKGLEFKDGSYVETDLVISNADIKNTVFNLVGAKYFPPEYTEKIRNLTYATQAMSIKVALDEVVTDQKLIMHIPVPSSEALELFPWKSREPPEKISGMITSPTNFDPGLAPQGNQSIYFAIFWTGSYPKLNQRETRRWGEVLLESLTECLPEIKGHVLWYRTDTPDLVEEYAGEAGNIIGIGQTVEQIHERRPSQVTPIKGLYIVGAEAGGHGIGTELAAESALELDKIISRKS